ncbi:hypothetical protein KI440_02115 [Candidatus Saccharibacteria bacterium TM7i]|nr:hypothetical protein KI440_02115 [Candidatus Saccharibacteria bacterium TM7i]
MDAVKTYLQKWNTQKNAFAKVQSTYIALAVGLFLVAAVISLINPNLGQSIIFFSLISFLVFVGNAVIWALLQTFIVAKLDEKPVVKIASRTRK